MSLTEQQTLYARMIVISLNLHCCCCLGICPNADATDMQITSSTAPDELVTRVRDEEQSQTPTPSTASPADSGDDDGDSYVTSVAVDVSTVERASAVVQDGRIALDRKLSIFTVMGTTEPRVVKLFPRETCSRPATASCYHIVAARRAVGLVGHEKR